MANTNFRPSKPHFFQPLLPGFHNEFLIPISFFKYLEGLSCEDAVLRSHRGKLWPVKINGQRIKDGWTDFALCHDLHVGDILVFRHEGNLVFDVVVFEPSACQREYPPSDVIQVDSMEEKASPKAEPVEYLNGLEGNPMVKKEMNPKAKASSSAIEHPYFCSTIKPSDLTKYRLNIPKEFARSNGLCNNCYEMVLKNKNGRSWPVTLRHQLLSGQVNIGCGWQAFAVANGLKERDKFKLELIRGENELIMTLYESEESKKNKRTIAHTKLGATPFMFGNPYFVTTLKPYNNGSKLFLPKPFTRSNGLSKGCCKMVLMDQKQRLWPVKLGCNKSDNRVYIRSGWHEFRVANGLKEGDAFIFELIKKCKTPIMKFHRF